MDNLAPMAADKEQNYNSEWNRETSRPDFAEATHPEFTLVSEVWIWGRFERHGWGSSENGLGVWEQGVLDTQASGGLCTFDDMLRNPFTSARTLRALRWASMLRRNDCKIGSRWWLFSYTNMFTSVLHVT